MRLPVTPGLRSSAPDPATGRRPVGFMSKTLDKAGKESMKKRLSLQSFRLQNFKAVRDSGVVKFTPLTVFVGNNGSGKSSLIEGLETFRNVVTFGLDAAMQQWRGFEHVWNHAVKHELRRPVGQRAS